MAAPISDGRMIRKDISKSKGFAAMPHDAQLLFCLLIPHFNSHGKMNGNPYFIKGEVVPLLDCYGTSAIERCLLEISAHTNVKWYEVDGIMYLQATKWEEHQQIRQDKIGKDLLPDYSGTTPVIVPLEVKEEVKEEVEEEVEVKEEGVFSNENTLSGLPEESTPATADDTQLSETLSQPPDDPPGYYGERIPYQRIINITNTELKANFRTTEAHKKLIRLRWKEGFREDDFRMVCRIMKVKWGRDNEMQQYLRPLTLFGNKMDGYLNQKVTLADQGVISKELEKSLPVMESWAEKKRQQQQQEGQHA